MATRPCVALRLYDSFLKFGNKSKIHLQLFKYSSPGRDSLEKSAGSVSGNKRSFYHNKLSAASVKCVVMIYDTAAPAK